MDNRSLSSPTTPETPLTNSLRIATSTVNDLTTAIANFSRIPSPEPSAALGCCCKQEECDNAKSWLALKSRLESRLILSAEVGQALLQRHEAYVRQHEGCSKHRRSRLAIQTNADDDDDDAEADNTRREEERDAELADLYKDNHNLRKQLNQALVNNEVTEVSNKTVLQELQEARSTISRLTAHHARSLGWDSRLQATMKERDDMQQERDSESQRARLAETRFAALREKTAKLQVEVRLLQEALEEKRSNRLESSESLIQDARTRLEAWQTLIGPHVSIEQEAELTKILQSLVNDNETLKRDNAELQHFLSDTREELHALQEEVDEQRANPQLFTPKLVRRPSSRHSHTSSVPSILFQKDSLTEVSIKRTTKRNSMPLSSPNPSRRSITPLDTPLLSADPKLYPNRAASYTSADETDNESSNSPEQYRAHRTLLLLSRSRGTQTDPVAPVEQVSTPSNMSSVPPYATQPRSTPSPHERSESSSSYSESITTHVTTIIDRANALLARMTQADPLTLTNRLKRQNLKGADIGHLSRTTINSITNEVTNLRMQFRTLLEDERLVVNCTRRDLRLLFKFLRDAFNELGQIRGTLNDIILDPSIAVRISEHALNTGKDLRKAPSREGLQTYGPASWIAPISKLFQSTIGRDESNTSLERKPPKAEPALSATASIVNVEFSKTGRFSTSTFQASPRPEDGVKSAPRTVPGLMEIFAGAPRLTGSANDPWVVIPDARTPKRNLTVDTASAVTLNRAFSRLGVPPHLSLNVDAVIDAPSPSVQRRDQIEENDIITPLPNRPLRRRGLSDTSIHSTFLSHGDQSSASPLGDAQENEQPGEERDAVLQTLSRTVHSLRWSTAGTPSPAIDIDIKSNSTAHRDSYPRRKRGSVSSNRSIEPTRGRVIPQIPSWGSGNPLFDSDSGAAADRFMVGSVRHENAMRWTPTQRTHEYTRDFV